MSSAAPQFLDASPSNEEIKRKIQSLQVDLRMLEQYRNSQVLISRLPSEILSTIFEHIALGTNVPWDLPFTHPYETLLSVSQVCRLWRGIALNSPRMWGCIYDHTRKEFTELLLERIKSAPVYLRSCNFRTRAPTVELLLQRSDRLKEVRLPNCTPEWVATVSQSQWPVLEEMSLALDYRSARRVRFAPELEPGRIPPLRHLSLTNCAFDLNVPFLSHLHTLKMGCPHHSLSVPLSLLDIYHALGNMENLETLELIHVADFSDIPDTTLHLPHLNSIRMEVHDIQSLAIFTRFACPRIQSVVVVALEPSPPKLVTPIASAIYAMTPSTLGPWTARAKVLAMPSASETSMKIWPNLGSCTHRAPFRMRFIGTDNFQSSLALCSSLPASASLILTLEDLVQRPEEGYEIDVDIDDLRVFLRSLSTVQELRVNYMEDLLIVLSDTPKTLEVDGSPLPLFSLPSLKHIRIWSYQPLKKKEQKLIKLAELLAARKAVNAGIETLRIRSYKITEDDAENFREYVSVVEVSQSEFLLS